jgi:hypothetical protein
MADPDIEVEFIRLAFLVAIAVVILGFGLSLLH